MSALRADFTAFHSVRLPCRRWQSNARSTAASTRCAKYFPASRMMPKQQSGKKSCSMLFRMRKHAASASGTKPARIVLIEDNPADILILRHGLDQLEEEYDLEVLLDGEQAMGFVQDERTSLSDPERPEPCVIVLDLYLPKYDGVAVLEAIRKEPVLAHVKVIVLTTLSSPRDELEIRRLGVRLFRTKPTQLADYILLAEEILAICREYSPAAAA
jgi:CheY-like chemotaxis protein